MYSFMGGGLFCAWVGTILLVVATATDHWMQYRLSGSFAHQGLWRYCLGNKCYLQTESIGKVGSARPGVRAPDGAQPRPLLQVENSGSERERDEPRITRPGRSRLGISGVFSRTIMKCTRS